MQIKCIKTKRRSRKRGGQAAAPLRHLLSRMLLLEELEETVRQLERMEAEKTRPALHTWLESHAPHIDKHLGLLGPPHSSQDPSWAALLV